MSVYKPGVWEGQLSIAGRKSEVVVTLALERRGGGDATVATGTGTDATRGEFRFRGEFGESAPFPCTMRLDFDDAVGPTGGPLFAECKGWREKARGGVFGEGGGSNVSLAPATGETGLARRVLEKAEAQRRESLEDMGFDEEVVTRALRATSTLDEAIGWAVEHGPAITGRGVPPSSTGGGGSSATTTTTTTTTTAATASATTRTTTGGSAPATGTGTAAGVVAAVSGAKASPANVALLAEMGFDSDQAKGALEACGDDVDAAAAMLLG